MLVEIFFGQIVETIVVGYDKTSHFKFLLDGHDHMSEGQHPGYNRR